MLFRSFSSPLLLLFACAVASAKTAYVGGSGVNISNAESPRRNIVYIIIDDIGSENIDVFDDEGVSGPTPQMDALAAEGIRFTSFAAQTVCSPFRASALTGTYPQVYGVGVGIDVEGNDGDRSDGVVSDANSIPRILAKNGYRTEAFGKWHIAGPANTDNVRTHPGDIGFQSYAVSMANPNNSVDSVGSGTYESWEKCTNGTCVVETTYATTDTTDDAISALSGTEPFFLWIAYHSAHKPIHIPPANLHTYDATCLDPAENERLCYKAAIEALDKEVGRLMDAIDRDDTTVILVSDNGTPADSGIVESPRTVFNTKQSLAKWAIETPMIVAGDSVPAARHGDVNTAFANSTDLYKTALELAGVNVPANERSTSVSLVPTFRDGSSEVRDIIFVERFNPNGDTPSVLSSEWIRMIWCSSSHASCNVSYKLIQNLISDSELFYNKNADPGETSALDTGSLNANQQTAYNELSVLIQTEGLKR